jgi:hypothetical protein
LTGPNTRLQQYEGIQCQSNLNMQNVYTLVLSIAGAKPVPADFAAL